jgi:hypothetical protein
MLAKSRASNLGTSGPRETGSTRQHWAHPSSRAGQPWAISVVAAVRHPAAMVVPGSTIGLAAACTLCFYA